MKILLTGGCGFIGSAVIRHAIAGGAHEIVNVDKMTYAASEDALEAALRRIRATFWCGPTSPMRRRCARCLRRISRMR